LSNVKRSKGTFENTNITPILKFWNHHLTLYTTSILMGLDLCREITHAISDINSQVTIRMDSYADEQKLIELGRLLIESDVKEEAGQESNPVY
jgi:hypothetical protein